jgi:hypothetical protein
MGHEKVVELLLGKDGVDVNKTDNYGVAPLFIASRKGHQNVVKLLLEKADVKVNEPNFDGKTPLMVAAHGIVRNLLWNYIYGDGMDFV